MRRAGCTVLHLYEVVLVGVGSGFGSVGSTGFGEDVGYVADDCVATENQFGGDLPVGAHWLLSGHQEDQNEGKYTIPFCLT